MSWVGRDSSGKRIYRKRPMLNVTVSPLVVQLLDELAELTGKNRSQLVDEILLRELPRLLDEVRRRLPTKAEAKPGITPGLETEYMRKLLFGGYKDSDWEQVV